MTLMTDTQTKTFSYQGSALAFNTNSLRFQRTDLSHPEQHGVEVQLEDTGTGAVAPMELGINFVTLNIAHDCNMACPYCFAKQGLYGGPRQLMTEATAFKSVDWLLKSSGKKQDCYLRFLGGEPFMNLPVMSSTMAYVRHKATQAGKKLHFSINTNGTIFNQKIEDLLHEYKVKMSVSMDGTKEAHDAYRIFRSGRGTYDVVAENVPKFLACDPYTMVNATLTAEALDLYEYAVLFRELGFKLIRFAMVGTSTPGISVRREEMLQRLHDNYDRLANRYLEDMRSGSVWYLADFYKYFDNLRYLRRRMNRCGAGTSYVNLDVNGDVHLCHRFTADKTQHIGNIQKTELAVPEGIPERNQLRPYMPSVPSGGAGHSTLVNGEPTTPPDPDRTPMRFIHRRLDGTLMFDPSNSQPEKMNICSGCDIRYLCGGSCFHDSQILFGDLHAGPDAFKCEVDRHLARISIWLLDHISRIDPVDPDALQILDTLDTLHQRSVQHTTED